MSMIRVSGEEYPRAQCDHDGCEELAPAPGEWLKLNPGRSWPGWNSLGWWCMGGTHLCPKHAPKG